jgi:membrane protein
LSDRPSAAGRARAELWIAARAAWRGFVELISGDDLTHAASVAYCGLLSLFPVFLLAFSIFGAVAANESHRAAVIEFFLRYFPARFDFVSRQLDSLGQMRYRIGVGGGLALVWAAHGVFSAITSAINYAWKVEKPRSYLKHKLFALLMLATAGVILLAALVLVSVIQIVHAGWFATVVAGNPRLEALGGMAMHVAATLMLIAVVALIYAFVPHAKVRLRDVWVGAILTGLLLRVVLEAFSYYVRDLSRLNAIHGSIAAVVVFLIWVYSSAVVLLYGAEFTATHIRLRREASAGQR